MTWTWSDVAQTNDNSLDATTPTAADTNVGQLADAYDIITEMLYWTDRREADGRTTCDMVAYRRIFRRAREFVSKSHEKSDA